MAQPLVYAQSSFTHAAISGRTEKIRILFEQGMHQSVIAEIASLPTTDQHAERQGFLHAEELTFYGLASAIALGQASSVKRAEEELSFFKHASLRVRLAFHLGHYHFLQSSYESSLRFFQLTDSLVLSQDEQDRVRFEKGVSLFSMNRLGDAKVQFNDLIKAGKKDYRSGSLYYAGCIAFGEKNYNEALKLFSEIDKDPEYEKVVPFYLSYLYHLRGEDEKAIQYGEAYLRKGDGLHQSEMLLLMASIYFNRKNFERSVDLYEKATTAGLMLTPDQRFELGSGYYHLEKHSKAIEQLKPLSVGKDTIALNSMYLLGHAYLHIGDKKNARSAFQYCMGTLLSKEKLGMAEFLIGKLSLELGFEDQGLQGLSAFINKYPASDKIVEAREMILSHYARTNNFKQAAALIGDMDPRSGVYSQLAPRIFYGRAIEFFNDLQYDSALVFLNKMVSFKSTPLYGPSVFWKGEIAFRKEDYKTAILYFEDYLKLPATLLGEARIDNALYNLGYAHLELEEYDKALRYFEKLNAMNKQIDTEISRESILLAADCAMMENDFTKARGWYTRISSTPGYGSDYALFQLAVLAGAKSIKEKIRLLKDLQMQYPKSEYLSLITMELADAYLAEEDFANAIPCLQRIPDMVEKDDEFLPSAFLKLGIALYNLGNDTGSLRQFRYVLEKYPTSTQAAEALDNARAIFVEKGKIDEYQLFLEASGKTMGSLQRDSLFFQYVQTTYAEGNSIPSHAAISEYLKQFPSGMYVAEALNYQSELFFKEKDWKNAADAYARLAEKGVSRYQEKALRQAAKLYFFELKDYAVARKQFASLAAVSTKPEVILESLRGEVRCIYFLKQWAEGAKPALTLLNNSGASQEDKAIAGLVLGYAKQKEGDLVSALGQFEAVFLAGNSSFAAEAGYQLALGHFAQNKWEASEKMALESIERSGSSDFWKTKCYLLLSDIAFRQGDYFNAKATLKSIIDNSRIPELKEEAISKLKTVEAAEKGKDKK